MKTNSNMIVISNQLALRGLLCLVLGLGTACTGNQPGSGDQTLGLDILGMLRALTWETGTSEAPDFNNEQVSWKGKLSIGNGTLELDIKLNNPSENPVIDVKFVKVIMWSGHHLVTARKHIDFTLGAKDLLDVCFHIKSKDLSVEQAKVFFQRGVTVLLILGTADGSMVVTKTENLTLQ